ncbi:MAG: hypothetical protein KBS59_05985, partial [Clostridiales bacterium]|nr:hypothetical protein [Clostridiales bacterium]
MKKLFALVFAIIILAVSLSSLVFAESEEYKGTYVVFGDSIAAGYGLDDSAFGSDESMYYVAGRDSDAYAGIVARTLGYDLYNFAQSGATSADLLQRLTLQKVADAIKKADLITISIGGNDLIGMTSTVLPLAAMHELFGTSQTTSEIETMFANLKANLKSAISQISAQNPS